MWSSWYLCGAPSNRILMVSSASTIQAYLFGLAFSQYCGRFPSGNLLVLYKALLLASEFPTFYERFSWYVWILHHLVLWWRYHVIVLHDRAFVSRWPTFASLHQTYAATYLAIHCRVLRLFVSSQVSPGPCVSVRWPFAQWINLVKPVHASDNYLSPSTFQKSSICVSNNTSSDVCVVLVTSMYFIGIGHDSSLVMYSLTLGSTWWRQMKSPVLDQKSFLASASSRVESSWRGFGEESTCDSPRKTSCSSPCSGRSLIKVDGFRRRSPPESLDCSICDWEKKIVTFHRRQHFLCIEPSGVDFWCVHLLQFFNVCDHNVSFPDSPRIQYITDEKTWQDFWTKLM